MTISETYNGPLYVPETDAPNSKIVTATAARTLAEPGLTFSEASIFFRNLLAAGYVHPYSRQRTGKRAFYYKPDQLVIAAVLHRMTQAGMPAEEQRRAASLALSATRLEDTGLTPEELQGPVPPGTLFSPAMKVLLGYMDGGRGYTFELVTQYNTKTGQTLSAGRVRKSDGTGTSYPLDSGWTVRSVFTVDLDSVLAHLTRERELAN